MSDGFSLRRLEVADVERYRDVRLEGLRLNPDYFGSSAEIEEQRPLAAFADRLEQNWVLGGFRGEHLMGVGGLHVLEGLKERHKGFLFGMYVRAEARGSGLAQALVAGLLAHAAEVVEAVTLTVTATNAAAVRLYVRAGFSVYGVERGSFKIGDRYLDSLLMSRPV